MTNLKKRALVQILQDLLSNNPNFVLVNVNNTKHQALEKLRRELKINQASLKVVKNSLLEKSFNLLIAKNKKYLKIKEKFLPLKDNTAVLSLDYEWSKGLRIVDRFQSDEKSLSFKLGYLDGQIYSLDELDKIAKLPDKNQLQANLLSGLKSPSVRLVNLFKYNQIRLVLLFKNRVKKN